MRLSSNEIHRKLINSYRIHILHVLLLNKFNIFTLMERIYVSSDSSLWKLLEDVVVSFIYIILILPEAYTFATLWTMLFILSNKHQNFAHKFLNLNIANCGICFMEFQ